MKTAWDRKLAEVANSKDEWIIRIGNKMLNSWMSPRYDFDDNGDEVPLPSVREYRAVLGDGESKYFISLREARKYLNV